MPTVELTIKGHRYLLILSGSAYKALEKLNAVETSVRIEPVDTEEAKPSSRLAAITQKASEKKQMYERANAKERFIVEAWNKSSYMINRQQAGKNEARNNPITSRNLKLVLLSIRKALTIFTPEEIKESIRRYFDFCSQGQHIWKGQNHGFTCLDSFLKRITQYHKENKRPWWDTRDDAYDIVSSQLKSYRLAMLIANSYAQTFLREQTFDTEQSDTKVLQHFIDAANKIHWFTQKQRRKNIQITDRELLRHLLSFLVEEFLDRGQAVQTGLLCSSTIWTSSFPQYLIEAGVIASG